MPNHIRTIIKPTPASSYETIAEQVLSMTDAKEDKEAKQYFDFNKIIPEPENIEKGECSDKHEPGIICWYKWNTENWGTKWGAYDFDEYGKYDKQFSFQTAWSSPFPVVKKLSEMFPEVEFDVKYADEDIGSNLGHYIIKNGETTWERVFTGTVSVEDEKELFALRIRR